MVETIRRKLPLIVSVGLAMLMILLLSANLKRCYYGCFNGYDFGIYAQAIYDLSTWESFNPFVSIRGLKIFNDHFDPAIYVPAILGRIFGNTPQLLVIFEWIIFVLTPLFMVSLRRQNRSKILFFLFLYTFARGFLTTLTFPIHASFWSLPIWVALAFGIVEERRWWILTSALFLCLFKESYPFAILMLAFGYVTLKNMRTAGGLLGIALCFLFFNFYLRPIIFGELYNHGQDMVIGLTTQPFQYLWEQTVNLPLKSFTLEFVASFVLLLVFSFKAKKEAYLGLLALWPLFLIQYLSHRLGHQYHFPFYIFPLALFYFADFSLKEIKFKYLAILAIVFVLTAGRYYAGAAKLFIAPNMSQCLMTEDRIVDINSVNKALDNISGNSKIIATGGILSAILQPNQQLFHIGSHGFGIEKVYDYMILERNYSGDIFPLTTSQVEGILKQCSEYAGEILYTSKSMFMAKGKFPHQCFIQGMN